MKGKLTWLNGTCGLVISTRNVFRCNVTGGLLGLRSDLLLDLVTQTLAPVLNHMLAVKVLVLVGAVFVGCSKLGGKSLHRIRHDGRFYCLRLFGLS